MFYRPLGYYIFNVPVPEIPTRWIVSAFGMNNIDGFGIQDKKIEVVIHFYLVILIYNIELY